MAYYKCEPFGERNRDEHFGLMTANLINSLGNPDRTILPKDCRIKTHLDLYLEEKEKQKVNDEEAKEIFKALRDEQRRKKRNG